MNKIVFGVLFFLLGYQLVYAQTADEIISVTTDEDKTTFTLRDDWEQYMNYDLENFLIEQLSSSQQIAIYYVSPITAALHPGFREKEAVLSVWEYHFTVECSNSCNHRIANRLKEIALQSIPIKSGCPPLFNKFNKAVRLLDQEQTIIAELYFEINGLCFIAGDQSYYSKMKLESLADIIDLSDI
ncbi:MAG: hypothetical protein ACR2PR_12155 [Pseudohongiellaceae bacterium]